jgi:hypothetical protein
MCNTQLNSAIFALSGFGSAYFLHIHNYSFWNYLIILFYSGMETLQFVQHFVLDKCDNSINIYSTHIAWVYVWLQPLVFNIYLLKTTIKNKRIIIYNIILSVFAFTLAMDRHFFFIWHTGQPRLDEASSGNITCTMSGDKHLKWMFYLQTNNGFEINYIWYFMLNCLPAFWAYGFLFGLMHNLIYLSGMFIGLNHCNGNVEESIAYWCFISIPYLLIQVGSVLVKDYIINTYL